MRYRLPLALLGLVAIVLVAALIGLHPWSRPAQETASTVDIGGPFTLTDSTGRIVTDVDYRGKWMLVYFGFTRCPDACPTALNNIAGALDTLKAKRAEIAPIFITVDPARDTPAVMGHYVALFDKQIAGLTGTQAQIDRVEHEYRVYAAKHPTKDGGYTMDHSSIIYVMDQNGRFSTVIDGNASAQYIATKIEKLES